MLQPPVNIAIAAARRAARIILQRYARSDPGDIKRKGKNDFVSETDLAAEKVIIEEILRLNPNHQIEAEESGTTGKSDHVWIVDPLDGTNNFIRGIPHFCVSIALTVNGIGQHAVIYDPIRDDLYTASRGAGALLNEKRIRVGSARTLDGTILATGLPAKNKERTPAYLQLVDKLFQPAHDIRMLGSAALDLALVAAGKLDGFFASGLEPWDTAAGALLVREAGGLVTDFGGKDNYQVSGNVVAGNLRIAGEIIKQTRSLMDPSSGN